MFKIQLSGAPSALAKVWQAALLPLLNHQGLKVLKEESEGGADLVLFYLPADDPAAEKKLKRLLRHSEAVLVMAEAPKDSDGMRWLSLGAKGYMKASSEAYKIRQAVQSLWQGYVWVGQSLMQKMVCQITHDSPEKRALSVLSTYDLTERELETVEHILNGQSNAQIAQAMGISERTVKAHLHHIFKKVGVADRLALALKVMHQKQEGEKTC